MTRCVRGRWKNERRVEEFGRGDRKVFSIPHTSSFVRCLDSNAPSSRHESINSMPRAISYVRLQYPRRRMCSLHTLHQIHITEHSYASCFNNHATFTVSVMDPCSSRWSPVCSWLGISPGFVAPLFLIFQKHTEQAQHPLPQIHLIDYSTLPLRMERTSFIFYLPTCPVQASLPTRHILP
jgi:hypothetical protein